MANGYIGKISAIVTANTQDLSKNLRGAKADVERFALALNRSVSASARASQRAIDGLYTPLQRLQRQLQVGLQGGILSASDVSRVQLLAQSTREIINPAKLAAAQFDRLSSAVAGEFTPALNEAQLQANKLQNAIDENGRISERRFVGVRRRIEETTQALSRLTEAQAGASRLATGRELRFANPALVAENARAARLQQQAASLSPGQIRSGNIASLVGQQRQAAEEAASLQAALENARLTRGDTAAAQRSLSQQIDLYERLNTQIENQIGSITRQATAVDRLTQSQNSLLAVESSRRSGSLARQNANAFEDSTASLLTQPPPSAAGLFEPSRRTVESELARTARLREEFFSLPQDVQQSLESERRAINNIANSARDGAAGVGTLADANDRLARSIASARAAAASGGLTILSDADVEADNVARAAREIQQARDSLADNLSSGFGGAGEAGILLGIDRRAIRQIEGEFEFLQNRLSSIGAEARGPVVSAMERYRQVTIQAFRDGSIATDEGRRRIAAARDEVIRLGAAATNTNLSRFTAQLTRAGDVARGFGSRFGLAIQQAVFAVDDFFSVSGGLDQQIRAAGNNISQLGFILGGTAGLLTGVAVSIGGQLAAAVIRYRNGLVSVRDEAESLNKTLEDQRKAVSDVGAAFDSFVDNIVESAFSEATRKANEFSSTLDEIVQQLREIEQEQIASLDPGVIRERALQQSLGRRAGEASDVADILAIQRAIDASREREDFARRRALGEGPAGRDDFARIADGFSDGLRRALDESNDALAGFNLRNLLGRDRFEPAFGRRGESIVGALQPAIGNLIDLTGFGDDIRRAAGIQSFEQIARLEGVAEVARLRVAAAGGNEDRLLEAIAPLRAELDRVVISAGSADQGLIEFARGVSLAIAQVEASLASPEIREANRIFEEAARASSNVGQQFSEIRESAAEASKAGITAGADLSARSEQLSRDFEQASNSLKAARAAGDPAATREAAGELAAIRAKVEATREEAAAIDVSRQALDRFTESLDQVSQEAQSNLQQAQQRADESRRQDLGFSTPASRQERQLADADLQRQRELASNVEQEIASALERFRQQISDGTADTATSRRISEIDELLRADSGVAPRRREQLARERAALEQQAVAADPRVRRAGDIAATDAQQAAAAARGRELSLTAGQRAAEELVTGLDDIRQRFVREAGGGQVDLAAQREAQQRLLNETLRSNAPAIFALSDSVANAVAQGPSRAALNASDISTVEGARELNRLIRGDDAARDQNLVELQTQSDLLRQLVQKAEEAGVVPVAN